MARPGPAGPTATCLMPDTLPRRDPPLSICVYCGSRPGRTPAHAAAARDTGTLIGRLGWQLVYGGGRAGLMGEVADATLAAGGRVVGVIPQSLMERELGHPGLSELHVVRDDARTQAPDGRAQRRLPGPARRHRHAGRTVRGLDLAPARLPRQAGGPAQHRGLLRQAAGLRRRHGQTTASCCRRSARCCRSDAQPQPLLQRLGQLAAGATAPDDYSRT